MSFNIKKITHGDSLKVGSDDAPLKIVEYINLRCPYSKKYEETVAPSLNEFIETGQVQRIIKHFDKEKYGLEAGNILNQYINYDTFKESYALMKQIFEQQDAWRDKPLSQIPHVASDFGLSLQPSNKERSQRILTEVEAVNVGLIPTVFVGEEVFVGTADVVEFLAAVENNL